MFIMIFISDKIIIIIFIAEIWKFENSYNRYDKTKSLILLIILIEFISRRV